MSELSTIRIRASSLATLFDCVRRWVAMHLDDIRMPNTVPAHIGTSLHVGTGAFDSHRLPGQSPITAEDAAGVFVDALHNPEEDVDWGELSRRRAEQIGITLLTRYCVEWSPTQTWELVEHTLDSLTIPFPDLGIQLVLTGTLDRRSRREDGGRGIDDLKSGERAVDRDGNAVTAGHRIQLGVYELLDQVTNGVEHTAPARIIGAQTTSSPKLGLGEINRPSDALLGTEEEPGLLEHAARMLSTGHTWRDFPGNARSMLCSNRYCPVWKQCSFKS